MEDKGASTALPASGLVLILFLADVAYHQHPSPLSKGVYVDGLYFTPVFQGHIPNLQSNS